MRFVTQASQNQIEADGAVTATPGIILCIGTADCAPILLADYKTASSARLMPAGAALSPVLLKTPSV